MVGRKEGDAHGVGAGLGEGEPGDRLEEGVGDLGQDAGSVAGVRVSTCRAAVLQIAKNAKGARYDFVAAAGPQVRDETYTTRVVFETTVVKPLRGGRHHQ